MERLEHSWSERRSATLRDVAREVGVSESTVSVVLNRTRSGTRVSAATRRVVMEAAERLGYRPNALAQSLQAGRTNRIGIYSGRARLDARNLFFAEVLGGVCEAMPEFGANMVLHTSGNDPEMLLDLVSNRTVDGLIVHAGISDPFLSVIGDLRIPTVAVADRVESLPSICVDDHSGGAMIAQHLAGRGHRHALVKQVPIAFASACDRVDAFVHTAEQLGMRVTLRFEDLEASDYLDTADLRHLTQGADRATALFCWSDAGASRACAKLADLGLNVPGDVAVAGFDGFRCFYPPRFELTTIHAPWEQVGRQAVKTLMSLIAGDSVPAITILPIDFVRGATT